jgi:hypothetical protein
VQNSFSYFEEDDDILIVEDEDVKNTDATDKDNEDIKNADATEKNDEDVKNTDASERNNEAVQNADATEKYNEDVKNDTEKDDERKVFKSKDVESKEMSSFQARYVRNLPIAKKGKCKTKKKPKSQKQSMLENNVIISLTNVRNKFAIFGYLTEKEIEAIASSERADSDSNRKKCRRCNFKKNCHLNVVACTALYRNCTKCAKPGHFPKSKNCKASRKNKFQIKIKCQVASEVFTLKTNESKMEPIKFIMSPEVLRLVEQRIKLIENEISQSDQKEDLPPLRLRGGGSELPFKIPAFESQFPAVDAVADIFRSFQEDWLHFQDHPLCSYNEKKETGFACFFMLYKKLISTNLHVKAH